MEYKDFEKIMNDNLKISNTELIKDILRDFERFTTIYQFLPFEKKIEQYYYTKINVKYGYTLEKVVEKLLIDKGAHYFNKKITKDYECDHLFELNGQIYLIEQKVRDDHDSSKKRGQVENYLGKISYLKNQYNDLTGAFWFIDDNFHKNKKYYRQFLEGDLLYGEEINDCLGINICDKLKEYSVRFKENNQIVLPKLYFDYKNYSVSENCSLFSSFFSNDWINTYFFNNEGIPYEDMIKYFEGQRSSKKKDKLIMYLKERLNGKL